MYIFPIIFLEIEVPRRFYLYSLLGESSPRRVWPVRPCDSPRPPPPCSPYPAPGTPRSAGTCHGPGGSGKNLNENVQNAFTFCE